MGRGDRVMMLTIAEVHEHLYGARLDASGQAAAGRCAWGHVAGADRVMFALTGIGSPDLLAAAIPVVAGLLWWGGCGTRRVLLLIATGGVGADGDAAETPFPEDPAGLALGFAHEPSSSFPERALGAGGGGVRHADVYPHTAAAARVGAGHPALRRERRSWESGSAGSTWGCTTPAT